MRGVARGVFGKEGGGSPEGSEGRGGEAVSAQIDISNNIKRPLCPPVSSRTYNTQSNELEKVSRWKGDKPVFHFAGCGDKNVEEMGEQAAQGI